MTQTEVSTETPKLEVKVGSLLVSRTWKKNRKVTKEEHEQELFEITPFHSQTASVSYALKNTINLDNFESVQISGHCTLPCYPEEIEEAYAAAKKFVDTKIGVEVEATHKWRAEKRAKRD